MTEKSSPYSNLEPLLNPRSIAVIGASRNPASMGGRNIRYLIKQGYEGKIFPVNPKCDELLGLPCFSSVLDIPEPVDNALLIVPAKAVHSVLTQCIEKGVKAAIIYSAGWAELGEEGSKEQERIKQLARENDLRFCGPNCAGLINVHNKVCTCGSPSLEAPLIPGHIGVISQSGGVAVGSLLYHAQAKGIGFSYLISSGNEADVDTTEYMKYMIEDPNTRVIALFIEGIKDGKKFLEVADLARERSKPIVVLKIGRSEAGKKAAASHTAILTGSDSTYDAVCKQKGVIQVDDFDELLETAALFAQGNPPRGNGVLIVSPSGGHNILAADECERQGLKLRRFSMESREELAELLPPYVPISNPLDLSAMAVGESSIFKGALTTILRDENIDVVVPLLTVAVNYDDVCDKIVELSQVADKPIVVLGTGGGLTGKGFKILEENNVPLFRSTQKCFKAIKQWASYGQFVARKGEGRGEPVEQADSALAQRARALLKSHQGILTERLSKELLSMYGIPITREGLAKSPEEATRLASGIGYPVALKVMSPQITHKTDAKILKLGIGTESELVESYGEVLDNARQYDPKAMIEGVLVQEMVEGGVEVIAGTWLDPQFGPVIIFGLGGIFVEVFEDVSRRIAPLTRSEAEEMMKETKGFKILQGIRGRPRADIPAMTDLLLKFSRLCLDLEGLVAEIDMNPVMVFAEGKGVKVVDALAVLR